MSSGPSAQRSYLPGLTGLRGIGAVWVMCFHAQYGLDLPILEHGSLGVDLFFVLSGFVLSHAHGAMKLDFASYRTFLRDRFARIFPLHWTAMLLLAVILVVYPKVYTDMPTRFQFPDFVANALLVHNWGFTRPMTWNVPAWSLSTEWLVSLGFPAFLFVARRVRSAWLAALGIAACLLLFELFLLLTDNPTPAVQARAGVVRTILEFGAGCLLYRLFLTGVSVPSWVRWGALILIAIGLTSGPRTILAVFAIPVVILVAAQPSRLARFLSLPVMAFLGKISFSIYLLHWPLMQVSDRIREELDIHAGLLSFVWFCGYAALIIALSTITYELIENPARRLIRGQGLVLRPRSGRLLQLDR